MKKTVLQSADPAVAVALPLEPASLGHVGEAQPSKASLRADAKLAARCVAGEVAAWEDIYAQCHEQLCAAIQKMLGFSGCDVNLVDEIAARVWYALVANDGERLARYSPKRGARLITYIRAIARDELSRHYRSEIRRRRRETVAAQSRPQSTDCTEATSWPVVDEFLDSLTPAERGFCCEVLLSDDPEEGKGDRSETSIWQLTHRVYKKLSSFLSR